MKFNSYKSSLSTILLFLGWPAVGFIVSLLNKASKAKAFVFVAFCGIAGYFFKLTNPDIDSYQYAKDFNEAISFGIQGLIKKQALQGMIDVYSISSYSFVKQFASDPHILFAFWGVVFGFFIYKSFQFIIDSQKKCTSSIFAYVILMVMFLINPHLNINGVRFWTSTWVFFAGWLGYEIHNKKIWLYIMCITPLIHTTFIIPLALYVIYQLFPNFNIKLLYIGYLISFIIGTFLSVESIAGYIPFLDLSDRYSTYVDVEYAASRHEAIAQRSFLNTLLSELPKYFILVFMTWLYKSKAMFNYDTNNIISKTLRYTLLLACLCSLAQTIPSMGRFNILCELFVLYLLLLYIKDLHVKTSFLTLVVLVVFFAKIYNIFYIHNEIVSYEYLYPFAYLFY